MEPQSPTRKWPVRVGLALAVAVYLVYSSFGICAPFWWGHHGYSGAVYMLRARMTLRFHMLTPANWSGYDRPVLDSLYFHHPIGFHHLLTLLVPIFGEHEWLARGLGAFTGLCTTAMLYVFVARWWSRPAGLVAVVVWVTLPWLTSFSVLCDPAFVEFGCVLGVLHAYLLLLERPSRRALSYTAVANALGGLMMWEVYFVAPFLGLHAIAYGLTRRGRRLRVGRWSMMWSHLLITAAALGTVLAFHMFMTVHAGMWGDFLDSYRLRRSSPSAAFVINRHILWMSILYGPPPVIAGVTWLVVWLARVVTGRARRRDIGPLTFLYINTLYIYLFAEGSCVHLFRVFFYSGFFTLALTDLVSDTYYATRRLFGHGAPGRWTPRLTSAALLTLYLCADVPHAYANLLESRVMSGTQGQVNYDPHREEFFFAKEVDALTTPKDRVILHYPELGARKEMWYYLDRSRDEVTNLTQVYNYRKSWSRSVVMVDFRLLRGREHQVFDDLIRSHPVRFYDHYAMVDLRVNRPGESSYAFMPGPMSSWYRWFISEVYPPLHLERAGYLPGICDALAVGVPVAQDERLPPKPRDPRLLDCYRNYLVERGETAQAKEVTASLAQGVRSMSVPLGHARVVGAGVTHGVLRVLIEAGGPEAGEVRYQIERPGQPPIVRTAVRIPAPSTWRAGWLYVDEVPLPLVKGPNPELEVELAKLPARSAEGAPQRLAHASLGALPVAP